MSEQQASGGLVKGFVVKALALYAFWLVTDHFQLWDKWLIHAFMTESSAQVSTWLLNGLGFEADTYLIANQHCYIRIGGAHVLHVDKPCNGLSIMLLYVGFLIAYPGTWRSKLAFMAGGVLAVYAINVVRQVLLVLNYVYFPGSFEFNHTYVFTSVVYAVVFVLWITWANKYSLVANFSHTQK